VGAAITDVPAIEFTAEPTPTDEGPASGIVPGDTGDDGEAGGGGGLPLEAIIGGAGLLVILLYVALYMRGAAAVERYADGFVVEHCPVCQRGTLAVETRVERAFGIPRPRHTVRCDSCRSVLRQTGNHWWRYAVDRLENPLMYNRFNGREIDDSTLELLAREPIIPTERAATPVTPPSFVDDDDASPDK
jgi:hypothetical protein